MSRLKTVEKTIDESWIRESRTFFTHVIKDTLSNLLENGLTKKEQVMLAKLNSKWLQNYEAKEHMPKSNSQAAPPPRKRLSRATVKTTAKATVKPGTTGTTPTANATPDDDEEYVDANTLDDNEEVVHRINIPPLKRHWKCTSFDLKVRGEVCKRNLIQPMITWELLDSIMDVPRDEGTVIFQKYVDNMLQAQQVDV